MHIVPSLCQCWKVKSLTRSSKMKTFILNLINTHNLDSCQRKRKQLYLQMPPTDCERHPLESKKLVPYIPNPKKYIYACVSVVH